MNTVPDERRIERVVWGLIIGVIVIAGIIATVSYRKYEARTEIVKQQAVEQERVKQEEKTRRTEKRAETVKAVVPWAKDKN